MKMGVELGENNKKFFVHLIPETKLEAVILSLVKEDMWISEKSLHVYDWVGTLPDHTPDVDTRLVLEMK